MNEHAEKLEFEEAAKYRELLKSALDIAQKQKITEFDGENKDYIGIARSESDVLVQVFFVREGKLYQALLRRHTFPSEGNFCADGTYRNRAFGKVAVR